MKIIKHKTNWADYKSIAVNALSHNKRAQRKQQIPVALISAIFIISIICSSAFPFFCIRFESSLRTRNSNQTPQFYSSFRTWTRTIPIFVWRTEIKCNVYRYSWISIGIFVAYFSTYESEQLWANWGACHPIFKCDTINHMRVAFFRKMCAAKRVGRCLPNFPSRHWWCYYYLQFTHLSESESASRRKLIGDNGKLKIKWWKQCDDWKYPRRNNDLP